METLTSTAIDIPRAVSAWESGQIGLAIGIVLLALVTGLRRAKFTGILDSNVAPIVVAALGLVGAFAEELVRTGVWSSALIAAVTVGLPPLIGLFVAPRRPGS